MENRSLEGRTTALGKQNMGPSRTIWDSPLPTKWYDTESKGAKGIHLVAKKKGLWFLPVTLFGPHSFKLFQGIQRIIYLEGLGQVQAKTWFHIRFWVWEEGSLWVWLKLGGPTARAGYWHFGNKGWAYLCELKQKVVTLKSICETPGGLRDLDE